MFSLLEVKRRLTILTLTKDTSQKELEGVIKAFRW
jgi:hypothetical protein